MRSNLESVHTFFNVYPYIGFDTTLVAVESTLAPLTVVCEVNIGLTVVTSQHYFGHRFFSDAQVSQSLEDINNKFFLVRVHLDEFSQCQLQFVVERVKILIEAQLLPFNYSVNDSFIYLL